jgi:tRNA U55 pseudouridine synthase TruB
VGGFEIQQAQTLEQLKVNVAEEALGKILLPTDEALSQFPFVDLGADDIRRVQNGMSVSVAEATWSDGERVRMRDERRNLIAVAEFNAAAGSLHPSVVIARDNS